MIRQLDALEKVMEYTTTSPQRDVLIEQARRVQTGNLETVPEAADRADVTRAYEAVLVARVAVERARTR
jgi:flagellar basal body rod protein FlgC